MKLFERCTKPPAVDWSKSPLKAAFTVKPVLVCIRDDQYGFPILNLRLEVTLQSSKGHRSDIEHVTDAWFSYDDFIQSDTLYPLRFPELGLREPYKVVGRIATEELWRSCTIAIVLMGDGCKVVLTWKDKVSEITLRQVIMREIGTVISNTP